MERGLGSAEALKVLAGRRDALVRGLRIVDLWSGRMSQFSLAVDPDCPACAGRYDYLEGARAIEPARLCGRNAIQLAAQSITAMTPATSAGWLLSNRNVST